jgi:methanethiol oxidase
VAAYDPAGKAKDAMAVLDVDPASPGYGRVVGWSELPTAGNELHHFGWNACSSALCHHGHGDHGPLERRYLVVPGIRSSRTYVLDTKPDPRNPKVVWEITAEELAAKAGYSRPHTVHCGPGGSSCSPWAGPTATTGRAGSPCWTTTPSRCSVGGRPIGGPALWLRRLVAPGPRHRDHLRVGHPWMIEQGLNPEDLLGRRLGHHLNFWSMSERRLTQRVDLGDQHQLVFEVRPAHDPAKAWGFVGVVISVEDLSGSVWLWHRDGERWAVTKVITIPAEPADPELLPPALKPFGAVPPLISDIDLSVDDRWLYVSCWGTGELKQYDVADSFHPRETGSVRLGGIVRRQPHPSAPDRPLGGGPQMVEVSRDGRRVYVTNSLYARWDPIFYPSGVGAWAAKLDADPERGGLAADPGFFPNGDAFRGLRVHQTRLQGGDASSDSYCFTR